MCSCAHTPLYPFPLQENWEQRLHERQTHNEQTHWASAKEMQYQNWQKSVYWSRKDEATSQTEERELQETFRHETKGCLERSRIISKVTDYNVPVTVKNHVPVWLQNDNTIQFSAQPSCQLCECNATLSVWSNFLLRGVGEKNSHCKGPTFATQHSYLTCTLVQKTHRCTQVTFELMRMFKSHASNWSGRHHK